MDVTSLSRLLNESEATTHSNGLSLTVRPSWIIEGENRLSYTSLTRLVECCREHHWNIDIMPRTGGVSIDSTIRSLSATFIRPINAGSEIFVSYRVTDVHTKAYSLRFEVCSSAGGTLHAEFELLSVFVHPDTGEATAPPKAVAGHLVSIAETEVQHGTGRGVE